MKYLDPKADLTFKRVFGQEITDIEYLPAEIVPDNPLRKNSIVDVRCKDKFGRQ